MEAGMDSRGLGQRIDIPLSCSRFGVLLNGASGVLAPAGLSSVSLTSMLAKARPNYHLFSESWSRPPFI